MNCQNCGYKYCPFRGVDREIPAYLCEDFEQTVVNSVKHRADPDVATDMIRGIEKLPAADVRMNNTVTAYHVIGKPQTNADRIRAMTDEELAEFIAYSTSCETCVVRKSGSDECHNTNCSTAWLDWLKQEADNDP